MTALRPTPGRPEPDVLWQENSIKPGAASPIVSDGLIYTANRAGVLTIADAQNGHGLTKLRLQGSFWGTPALVGDRLLCPGSEGLLQVVRVSDAGHKAEIVGRIPLGETIQSSPAVSGGAAYLRSDQHLWKIGGAK
jgi:outer membrane protein assembly factor BamB